MKSNLNDKLTEFNLLLDFYFSRVLGELFSPPEHVYFSLTNRCNLRCSMCDISKHPSTLESELSTKKIKEIILDVKGLGIKHIIFSGGEPLLREDLFELIEFSTGNHIEMVDIITNGVLLSDNAIKRLIQAKLNHVTISLDGTSKINNNIRGQGIFEKVEENMDKLNYYKQRLGSIFPTLGINFTIMDQNIESILSVVEFAKSKKCNIVVFQPILFSNTKMYIKRKNALWPKPKNISMLRKNLKKIESIKLNNNDINIYTDLAVLKAIPEYFLGKRPGGNFKCYEGIKRIVITCEGHLWSCRGTYGDLNKESLRKIWFSKEAQRIRTSVKKCSEHCLQDCVYFPSDILNKSSLISKDNSPRDEKSVVIRKEILGKIEKYISILSEKDKNEIKIISRLFGPRIYRKEIDKLLLISKLLNC